VAKIGENIQIPRFIRYEVSGNGMIAAYIHTGRQSGRAGGSRRGQGSHRGHEDFKQLVRDITLQIAAGSPSVVSRGELPAALVAKEREIAAEQVKNKPPQAIAKIVEGKLEKYFQTCCLVDQGFVKRNSEISVKEHIGGIGKQLGDEITIRRFARFQVGETPAA
jgi:elongation factor Ts